MNKRFATDQDFLRGRKFCAFRVEIDTKNLIVEECGEAPITQDSRNRELRILWLGSIKHAPLGELSCRSASMESWSGYYVDYADNYAEAKIEAMRLARQQHIKMMTRLDMMLSTMQSTELVFVKRCKC